MAKQRKKRSYEVTSNSAAPAAPSVEISESFFNYPPLARYLALFTAAVLSLLYGLTLSPTVPGGDSGELITVAYGLGVAHPPGYPLYTLIAHVFSYLPLGSVAYRINLLSAVFSVMGGLLCFHLIWRWLKDAWVASVVSLFFFLSPLVWRYSVVAEVFSLNNLFILLLIFCYYEFQRSAQENRAGTHKWVWAMAATLGWACGHHHTILFLAVPLFLWICIFNTKSLFTKKAFLPSLGFFLSGFLPYLYIPWAAFKKDIYSWGEANTWQGFWVHFLRQEYGTFQLATGGANDSKMTINLLKYAEDLMHQTLVVAFIPMLIGLWFFVKHKKKSPEFLKAVLFVFVFYTLLFNYLANMDLTNRLFFDIQSRFWMFPNLLLCFFMAYGFVELKKTKFQAMKWAPIALALVYFPTQLYISYNHEDYSKNYVFENVGRATLLSLPPNAIMLMRGDIYVNSVRYLQAVEGVRPDVKAIPLDLMWWPWMAGVIKAQFPEIVLPNKVYRYEREKWDDFTLPEFFAANIDKFPIFTGKLRDDELKVMKGKYKPKNLGFINAILPEGTDVDFPTYRRWAKAFDDYEVPKKTDIRDRSWEAFVYYNYWDREVRRIDDIFLEASANGYDLNRLAYGAERLEKVIQDHPEIPVHIYKNLGVAYQFLSQRSPEYVPRMISAWRSYAEFDGKINDPDMEKIKAFLSTQDRSTASEAKPVQ